MKVISQNKYSKEVEKIDELKREMDSNRVKYEARIGELEKELKVGIGEWNGMEKEVIRLTAMLEQERSSNKQLENALADKTYEF